MTRNDVLFFRNVKGGQTRIFSLKKTVVTKHHPKSPTSMTEQQNFYPECQRHLLDLPQLPKTVQTQEVNTYAKHQVPPPTPPSTVGTMDPIPYETPAPSQEYQLQQQQEPLNLIHDFFASTVHHLADPSTPYLATSFDIQRFLESRFQSHFSTCSSATTTPTPAFAGSTVAAAPGSTAAAAATAAQTDAPLPAPAPAPSSTPHQFDFQITTCLQILFEVLIHKLETTDCIEITNTDATARFVEWTGENLFPLLQCYIGAADGAFELVALEVLLWTCLPLRRTIDGGLVNLGPVSSARMELFAPVLICLRKCGVVREGVVERWIEGVREKVAVAEEGERVVGGGGGGGSNGGSMFVGVADVLYKYERLASISEFLAFDGYDFDYAGVSAAPSPQNAAPPFVCWNGMKQRRNTAQN
ncbi:hypothetical protein BDR26DRAFT_168661 [Obelidium mucronatum]|nr:hypothetical protein BDR26DRAFT_168661 [Obelidium mucronatum]